MKKTCLFVVLAIISFCFSCRQSHPYSSFLDKATLLLEEFPDSAACYLDSIVSPEEMKEKDFHHYQLLRIQVKDKLRQPLIEDTTIFKLRGIYDKTDPIMASAIYYYSAIVYEEQREYEAAMDNCLMAEQLSDLSGDKHKGLIHNTIGRMFSYQALRDKAREKFMKSLEYFQKIGDLNSEFTVYNQISNSYLMEEKFDSTLIFCEKIIDLLEHTNECAQKAIILSDLSLVYIMVGDNNKAEYYLKKSLNYSMTNLELSKIYMNLAKINMHNPDLLYHYIEEALKLAEKENDLMILSHIYIFLSSIQEEQGLSCLALVNYKKHSEYMREHFEKNYANSMLEIQHKYQLKELQNENMNLTIKHQRLVIIGLVILALLLASWSFIYRQKKILAQAERNIVYLQKMSTLYNEKEKTLRSIVLKDFDILKKVALLENYMVHNSSNSRLIKKFNEIVYNQETMDWNRLYETIDSLHDNLLTKLKSSFPQLDETEFKISCLSIAKFTNAEIALLMEYSTSSIQWRKASIRKKLGVKPMGNIHDFLNSYFEKELDERQC